MSTIRKHSDRSRSPEAKRASRARRTAAADKRRATPADFRALERELKGL